MGTLYYGGAGDPIEIPEQLLAHVKVVITAKLRRNEKFTLTWRSPGTPGAGRSTIWLDPSIPLRFVFESAEAEPLDHTLLRTLADEAASSRGLVLDLDRIEPHSIQLEPQDDGARQLVAAGAAG